MKAEYIDHMGTDLTVVNSARVSFDKESKWEEEFITESIGDTIHNRKVRHFLSEKDQKLINYLARHGHWTPFSHVVIQMRETIPIFVARQRFKHMVGFTYNEVSRRYVDDAPEFYYPDKWRKRSEDKKQGSSDDSVQYLYYYEPPWYKPGADEYLTINDAYKELIESSETLYKNMIESGVAPEQARMVLPQSMYTSYYVTGSLAAWARAYNLRIKPDAQLEIRELAKQWDSVISSLEGLEYSWKALKHADM